MIRTAVIEDMSELLPLVKRFYDESLKYYGFSFDEDVLKAIIKGHCEAKSGLVLVEDDKIVGTIAGNFVQFPTSNYKVFQEVIWYVLPEYRRHGIKLFKETEIYCKSIGVQAVVMGNMANLNNNKMDNFYKSQGYKMMEVQWLKLL